MPKRWLAKRRWVAVLETTTYRGYMNGKIFIVKLYSHKIFSYVFLYGNIFTTK